jgi:hypothetical protein
MIDNCPRADDYWHGDCDSDSDHANRKCFSRNDVGTESSDGYLSALISNDDQALSHEVVILSSFTLDIAPCSG